MDIADPAAVIIVPIILTNEPWEINQKIIFKLEFPSIQDSRFWSQAITTRMWIQQESLSFAVDFSVSFDLDLSNLKSFVLHFEHVNMRTTFPSPQNKLPQPSERLSTEQTLKTDNWSKFWKLPFWEKLKLMLDKHPWSSAVLSISTMQNMHHYEQCLIARNQLKTNQN